MLVVANVLPKFDTLDPRVFLGCGGAEHAEANPEPD
jgi:hypothetical protein